MKTKLALLVFMLALTGIITACMQTAERNALTATSGAEFADLREESRDSLKNAKQHMLDVPANKEFIDRALRDYDPARPDDVERAKPREGEPYDMFFKEHGVNPFVDTEDDKLSTFAVDTDTGSYTVCRDYLNRGMLPPTEAARSEEFVNYFKYGYEAPTNGPFNIIMDCAPSRFGADLKNCHLLRVGLQGKVIETANRKPAVLTFCIDISGSMDMENRLGLVKRALGLLVNELREGDRVGIAVYGNRGYEYMSHRDASQKEQILKALNDLGPDGSTNAEEGIKIAYEMAEREFDSRSINRIILCSDGVANVGNTGPDAILKQVEAKRRKGITLTAVGFGMSNYNDTLMEQLGDKGDGHYAYVDTLDEARRVFVENLTGTLQVIARDVKVQIEFNPEIVKSYRLIGYENRDVADKDFRNDTVDGGEVGAGHSVTALYELKLYENKQGPLATTTVRYKHDERDEFAEVSYEIATRHIHADWDKAPANMKLAATVAELAELLRKSYWAKNGSFEAVIADAKKLALESNDNALLDFVALARKAQDLKIKGSGNAGGD
jgi:Ca-activated chloride channel family protein